MSSSRVASALESFSVRRDGFARPRDRGSSAASRSTGSGAKKLSASIATSRSSRASCSAPGNSSGRIPVAAITRSTGTGSSASSSRSISFCDAFAGELREAGLVRGGGAQRFGVDLALAVPGMEAEQAQDAQIIFADARRAASPTKRTRPAIRSSTPPDVIEHLAVGDGIERVHGEVAPRCASSAQSSVKATTAWRPSVSTSRRRVVTSNGLPFAIGGDGAVLDAGRHRLDALRLPAASTTSSGGMRHRDVDVDSPRAPSSALRTAPPTKRALSPSAAHHRARFRRRSSSACCAGSIRIELHHMRLPTVRRNSPASPPWRPRCNGHYSGRRRSCASGPAIRAGSARRLAGSSRKASGTSKISATSPGSGASAKPSLSTPTTGRMAKPVPVR